MLKSKQKELSGWGDFAREVVRSVRWSSVGTIVLVSALILVFLGVLAVSCHQQYLKPAQEDYEGLVVDKWMGFSQSNEGSFPYYRLLVEKKSGDRIKVNINYEEYQQARVGMWIRTINGRIEFDTRPAEVSGFRQ